MDLPWKTEQAYTMPWAPSRWECQRMGIAGLERCGVSHLRVQVAERHTAKLNRARKRRLRASA